MRRAAGMLAAVVATLLLSSAAAAASAPREPTLSGATLLARLADPAAALAPLPAGMRTVMVSSHDRTGGNVDGGSYGGAPGTLASVPQSVVRHEEGGHVLYEVHRPGCLVRTFLAPAGPPPGDAAGFGNLQIFVDGEQAPRFDASAKELFEGRLAKYPKPLVGDALDSSGGNSASVPFCFAKSVKVRTTQLPGDGVGWWQLNLLLAPPRTAVTPFNPDVDFGPAAAKLAAAGTAPSAAPAASGSGDLAPGSTHRFARIKGAGTVRYLRIKVTPFDAATLRRLSLKIAVDRSATPQIDVPLGALFGDGIETRPIRGSAFGMDPASETGYLALPIPYTRVAAISVAAQTPARVSLDAWTGPRAPAGAGVLHGDHHVEEARLGSDVRALDARGSGRLASVVYDVERGGPATGVQGLQRFLEGDERIHVDGSRSPSFYGTGHEELSNAGFYFVYGAFQQPLFGAGPFGTLADGSGTQSQYRIFGDDGPRWSSGLAFGMEHGGGDEIDGTVGVTTFSYRAPATLRRTDSISLGEPASERAHGLTGVFERGPLTAYFEGERDGNSTDSTVIAGGFVYPAPPAADSPEGVTANGIRFSGRVAFSVLVGRRNGGLVLRRVVDQAAPLTPLAVTVAGKPAGVWESPDGVANPSKRFLEADFDVPVALTKNRRRVRVTLTPQGGGASSLFGLEAWARGAVP